MAEFNKNCPKRDCEMGNVCFRPEACFGRTEDQEREAFEKWISQPPFERDTERWATDEKNAGWPGQYKNYETELAWCAWQERATDVSEL
jgi:hypothetical protein